MPQKTSLPTSIPSSILDNHRRGKVADFLLQNIEPGSTLSIVSAYFTIYAYKNLKKQLDSINKLNFLFGEPSFLKSIDPGKAGKMQFKIEDEKLVIPMGKRLQQKRAAKECADWIRQKVNIRSIVKSNFLHGKMYYIKKSNETVKTVVGSSNFTVRGLGLCSNPNLELNMEIDSDRDRQDLFNWFDEIWDDSDLVADVKDEVLRHLERLYQENSPQFIYYKTLYHLFRDYVEDQSKDRLIDEKIGFLDTKIWNMLYDFQKDGVRGVINKILKHNGCIIADSVGLGKTFEALAVIKYFELLNHRVLVLCPKKLKENWTVFSGNDSMNFLIDDKFSYDVLCHTDLSRDGGYSGNINLSTLNWSNYGLVVIDESHNFKNDLEGKRDREGNLVKLSRYGKLMNEIIKKGIQTRVLLLSATPVNNELKDLRNQIYLITQGKDGALFNSCSIKSISQTIKNAQIQFTYWTDPKRNAKPSSKVLFDKLESSFFKLLDELTIARSREHIRRYYDINKIGKFPERQKPISKAPDIDIDKKFPAYDKLNDEILEYKLSLFRPTSYLKDEFKDKYKQRDDDYNFAQETRENYLIGMMKVNYLKRLESSVEAFEISMKRTIDKISNLEKKIKIFMDSPLKNDDELDETLLLPEDAEEEDEKDFVGDKLKFNLAHIKLDAWLRDLETDRKQLSVLYEAARDVTEKRDEKLKVLKDVIRVKIDNPINKIKNACGDVVDNRKVLIFTAFADTAQYLYNTLKKWAQSELRVHIALVTGGDDNQSTFKPKGYKDQTSYNQILINFSPISKNRSSMSSMPQEGEIDILIATDCISEGQNLQDCDFIINYDIHWNPIRLIQRFGRIDRIGSFNKRIQMVNFWPTDDLNKYINLKDRVDARMKLADITATTEDNPLDTSEGGNRDENISYRDKQLLRLKDEVLDVEDIEGDMSLTEFNLDDYRMELMNFLKTNEKLLEAAPEGLYGVVPSPVSKYSNLMDFSVLGDSIKNIIKPGVIFFLRQREDTKDCEAVNPVSPYFIIYIYEDGNVRFNYTSVNQILDIFRILCSRESAPIEPLCEVFNDETSMGNDMEKYNSILMAGVLEIERIFKKRSLKILQSGRNAVLVPKKQHINEADGFDLVTWLVIK